jgi:hypothetical protein
MSPTPPTLSMAGWYTLPVSGSMEMPAGTNGAVRNLPPWLKESLGADVSSLGEREEARWPVYQIHAFRGGGGKVHPPPLLLRFFSQNKENKLARLLFTPNACMYGTKYSFGKNSIFFRFFFVFYVVLHLKLRYTKRRSPLMSPLHFTHAIHTGPFFVAFLSSQTSENVANHIRVRNSAKDVINDCPRPCWASWPCWTSWSSDNRSPGRYSIRNPSSI